MKRVFIIGGGGWGTALAQVLAEKAELVVVWDHDAQHAAQTERERENRLFLPGVKLQSNVHFTGTPPTLSTAELIVLAAPSEHLRAVWRRHLATAVPEQLAVVVTKGIEPQSLQTMTQVCLDECRQAGVKPPRLATLSGPSHAEEVGLHLATSVVAAADDPSDAAQVQEAFNNGYFRVYRSGDHLGVELGGSLKNVVALAAGVSDGLGLGDNAKAALITRGLAEMTRLGVAMGAQAATFAGLAGLGDLVVTCSSRHSRNRGAGERLGRGEKWADIRPGLVQAVEGAVTAASAVALAARHQVEMPIAAEVQEILKGKDPRQALQDLMRRPLKEEGV